MSVILDKLLNGQKVKWISLGQVAEIGTGNSNRQDEDETGTYPFYVRSKNILKSNIFQFDETAIIIPGEGGIGDIFHYVEGKYALHQRAYRIHVISEKLDTKFLYYVMNDKFKKYILAKSVGATATSIRKPMLENFEFPIPPLEVQTKIVKILDAFTALTAELTAELTMREKQYHYYRDKLLTFSDGEVEWKTLGELAKVVDGTHSTPKYTSSGIPFVSVENIKNLKNTKKYISLDDFNKYKIKPMIGDVFMTRIGDIGTCTVVEDNEPLAYYVTLALIRVEKHIVLPKYIKFFIESSFGKSELYKRTLINAVPIKINLGDISKIKIPVPSLAQQQRIINLLENFETLTNSITEGLPKEIALRRKQYEYYREQLLDFPK